MVALAMFVPSFVTVTETPTMTPPAGSFTVPRIVPKVDCPLTTGVIKGATDSTDAIVKAFSECRKVMAGYSFAACCGHDMRNRKRGKPKISPEHCVSFTADDCFAAFLLPQSAQLLFEKEDGVDGRALALFRFDFGFAAVCESGTRSEFSPHVSISVCPCAIQFADGPAVGR